GGPSLSGRRRSLLVRGSSGRRDQVVGLPHRTVRGRERPRGAPGRGRGRRHRKSGPYPWGPRQGVRHPEARTGPVPGTGPRHVPVLPDPPGALQDPADPRVLPRAPEDYQRQDPSDRAPHDGNGDPEAQGAPPERVPLRGRREDRGVPAGGVRPVGPLRWTRRIPETTFLIPGRRVSSADRHERPGTVLSTPGHGLPT